MYKKVAVVTHNGCLRTLYYLSGLFGLEETLAIARTDSCGIVRATLDATGKLELQA